jgi:hypothetical protein
MATTTVARSVQLPPSRWIDELVNQRNVSVEAEQEPLGMEYVLLAMERCPKLVHVDLFKLSSCENQHEQNIPRLFFDSAPIVWQHLVHLRLGKGCLNRENADDQFKVWDVARLCEAIPKFKVLRVLNVSQLDLDSDHGSMILDACGKSPSVKELDMGMNGLHHIDDIVDDFDVVCGLEVLKLDSNAFGEFDEDSFGYELTCSGIESLFSQYTSLRELDIGANAFYAGEGLAIAKALENCTHLCKLDVSSNYWDDTVADEIRKAWRGPADGLLL